MRRSRWWKETVVFGTGDDAQGGVDHIDAHRTVVLCAGPWMKKGYVSQVGRPILAARRQNVGVAGRRPAPVCPAWAESIEMKGARRSR